MTKEIATTELNTIQDSRASSLSLITNDGNMTRLTALAKMMASSKVTVPKHLQGSEGDCMAIIIQATNWGMNPFAVAQKTHLVTGVLGYEAQLVNAVICGSGSIVGAFEYEYRGEGSKMECRVGAVLRGQTHITWGQWLMNSDVTTRNSPLWKTNPAQQLGYLQVKNWGRQYAPGAILGVYTVDELEPAQAVDVTPRNEPFKAEKTPGLPEITEDELNALCADKLNVETGEIIKMGHKSKVQSGQATAEKLIEWLSAKASVSEEIKVVVMGWEPIEMAKGALL